MHTVVFLRRKDTLYYTTQNGLPILNNIFKIALLGFLFTVGSDDKVSSLRESAKCNLESKVFQSEINSDINEGESRPGANINDGD